MSFALAADTEEARHELPDEGRHTHQQVRDRLGRHPLSGACTVALELDPEVGIARPDIIVEDRQEVLQALRIEEVGVLETRKTQGEHRLGAIGAVLRNCHRLDTYVSKLQRDHANKPLLILKVNKLKARRAAKGPTVPDEHIKAKEWI